MLTNPYFSTLHPKKQDCHTDCYSHCSLLSIPAMIQLDFATHYLANSSAEFTKIGGNKVQCDISSQLSIMINCVC